MPAAFLAVAGGFDLEASPFRQKYAGNSVPVPEIADVGGCADRRFPAFSSGIVGT